jgi:hypothetical protein
MGRWQERYHSGNGPPFATIARYYRVGAFFKMTFVLIDHDMLDFA